MGQVLELVLLGFGLNWCWQNRPQNSETQNRDQIYHMKVLECKVRAERSNGHSEACF